MSARHRRLATEAADENFWGRTVICFFSGIMSVARKSKMLSSIISELQINFIPQSISEVFGNFNTVQSDL
jgi:hypothetical protein